MCEGWRQDKSDHSTSSNEPLGTARSAANSRLDISYECRGIWVSRPWSGIENLNFTLVLCLRGANMQGEQVSEMSLPAEGVTVLQGFTLVCLVPAPSQPRTWQFGHGGQHPRQMTPSRPQPQGRQSPAPGRLFMAAASSTLPADSPTCLCVNFQQACQIRIMAPGYQRCWEGKGRKKRRRKQERAAKESGATHEDGVHGACSGPRSRHYELLPGV